MRAGFVLLCVCLAVAATHGSLLFESPHAGTQWYMYTPGCVRFHYTGPDSTADVFVVHPASSTTVWMSGGVPLTSSGYYSEVDIYSYGVFPGDVLVRIVTDGGNTHESPMFSLVVDAVGDWIPSSCSNTLPTPSTTQTPAPSQSRTTTGTPSTSPSSSPSNTAATTPSNTASNTPSQTRTTTGTPSTSPSSSPSNTAATTPSNTASTTPSSTAAPTPSRTASTTPPRTPTNTPSRTASTTPTRTASGTPTRTPSRTPSSSPITLPKVAVMYCGSASLAAVNACNNAQTALTNLGWTFTTFTDTELIPADLAGAGILIDTTTNVGTNCGMVWGSGTAAVIDTFLTGGGHGFFQFEHSTFNSCNNIKLAMLNNHITDAPLAGGATEIGACTVNTAASLGPDHGCAVTTPNSIGGTAVTCTATNDFNNFVDADSSLVFNSGSGVHAIYGGSDSVGSSRMIFWSDVNWSPQSTDLPEFENWTEYLRLGC